MSKYLPEIKIKACEDYLSGKYSHKEVCEKYGIYFNDSRYSSAINDWLPIYSLYGPSAFLHSKGNQKYSSELKEKAVLAYLSGEGSYKDVSAKYKLRSTKQLREWVLLYNANRELKDYCPKPEVYMAESRRKTTIEERKDLISLLIYWQILIIY